MLLVHLHHRQPHAIDVPGLHHVIYGNSRFFVSDLFPVEFASSRHRFSFNGSELPERLASWAEDLDDVVTLTSQLRQIELTSPANVLTFAIAAAFLIKQKSNAFCRTVCWKNPNEFATVGWTGKSTFIIKIRQNDQVYKIDSRKRSLGATANFDVVASPTVDPHRDNLAWQFNQSTYFELGFEDIEGLVKADPADTDWKVVGG